MPNTPMRVLSGAAGMSPASSATPEDREVVQRMFGGAAGCCVEVAEPLLDAVTGLAGSGPAMIAVMIEAMADAGVTMGLSRAQALQLAAATVRGTGHLCATGGRKGRPLHPAVVKDLVCSPGGTSIAGVNAFDAAGGRRAVGEAVVAATKLSRALGKSKL
jgi:pyrroline-5-carboxylate reductase